MEEESSNLSLLLGFKEAAMTTGDFVVDRPGGLKLVPWLSWNEWDSVRDSLFSSSPPSIASALQRITAWRSRGCLPVLVEVTASIVEIQQKDPFFRADLVGDALDSDEILAMLYCMAIMRLVNGVVEKTRKKTEVSIAEAADAINIPRMLIDIRHEGSHRDLPSIRLVRVASIKALDWLKSYYWEPQKNAILSRSDGTASLRKEIKSKLCEWAFCLKTKQDTRSSSSLAKGKPRIKHCEPLCGRNKFLSLVAGKPQSSKSAGSKKQITKALKHLVRLYSSYSSEVVSVLIELLLKGSNSLDSVELPENYQYSHNTNHLLSIFDDWKLVIAKLSKKAPELLLTLTKAVLEMIETAQAMESESGERAILKNTAEAHNIERLWCLFDWLVGNLKGLKPMHRKDSAAVTEGFSADISLPKVTLTELLRKSLLVSCPGKNQLRGSALILAHLIGNSSLYEKLNKLCSLRASNPTTFDEDNSSIISSESILSQQDDSIHQAAEKLERVKLRRMKRKVLKTTDGDLGNNKRWVLAKSWNSCPIGMLPRDVGSSGRLPVLDRDDDDHCKEPAVRSLESKEQGGLNECTRKRGPNIEVELLNYSHVKKKMRENEDGNESDGKVDDDEMLLLEGIKGQLMIGGIWKKVGEEELLSIASAVRILV